MPKNKVLIPLDEAEFTLQIVPYLFRYLNPEENEVVLLHVVEESTTENKVAPTSDYTMAGNQTQAAVKANFMADVSPYLQALQKAGFTVSTCVRFGNLLQEIEKFMKSEVVNLVAMTTWGVSNLAETGTTAQHVMEHVTVPIMLYHTAGASVCPSARLN